MSAASASSSAASASSSSSSAAAASADETASPQLIVPLHGVVFDNQCKLGGPPKFEFLVRAKRSFLYDSPYFSGHLDHLNPSSMSMYQQGVLGFSPDGAHSIQVSKSKICASHRTKNIGAHFLHVAFFREYFIFYPMSVRAQDSSLATGTSSHTMRRTRSTSPSRIQTWFVVAGMPTPRPCF
jgi:hypothetical protein